MESTNRNGIPTRPLGSTGQHVTILGVGGYHSGKGSKELGVRIVRTAIDEGINFMDNAHCYNGGDSERMMGEALQDGYRDKVFLMTKNHGRDGESYREQLEGSLRRLRTDVIDLVQFHDIGEGDAGSIFERGAFEAALRAQEEGKIRFIGFTGHRNPSYHQEMLDQDFAWDTVQLPVNLLDAQYHSFLQQIVPQLERRGIGIIGMKSLSGNRILRTEVPADKAIAYALSQPVDTLVSGIDSIEILQENLATVRSWQPMSEQEQKEWLARVATEAADGHLEGYKKVLAA